MRTRIADYEIIRPLDDDHGDRGAVVSAPAAAQDARSGASTVRAHEIYLAQSPPRLGIGDVPVVVHAVATTSEETRTSLERRLFSLTRARSAQLPVLLELGADPGEGETPGDPTGAERTFWSHTWTGDATLEAPPFTLSLAYVLWLVTGAARGAHALHEAGLAHGHITPRAIRFNEREVTLDLPPGAPEVPEGLITHIGRVDDLDLVDPAVARGELPSWASDIWTLGAVLYRGLTGQLLHPGLGEDPPVTAAQRVMFQPPTISPGLDPDAARIMAACLIGDPARRPRTAGELADQLETLGRQR